MRHLNEIHLIGRLGKEPALRYTPAGQPVATLSVATDRPGPQDAAAVDWHRVILRGQLAEVANRSLGRGRLVGVSSDLSCLAACRSPVPWPGRGRCDGLGSAATDRVEGPASVCAAAGRHALPGA